MCFSPPPHPTPRHIHGHIHMHTHTHAHTHTHTHARTHTHTRRHTHAQTGHIHTHTHTHTHSVPADEKGDIALLPAVRFSLSQSQPLIKQATVHFLSPLPPLPPPPPPHHPAPTFARTQGCTSLPKARLPAVQFCLNSSVPADETGDSALPPPAPLLSPPPPSNAPPPPTSHPDLRPHSGKSLPYGSQQQQQHPQPMRQATEVSVSVPGVLGSAKRPTDPAPGKRAKKQPALNPDPARAESPTEKLDCLPRPLSLAAGLLSPGP